MWEVRLQGLVLERNGMLGANTVYADHLRISNMIARNNNAEHSNSSPVSRGLKVT
jgi:hypothetical protein